LGMSHLSPINTRRVSRTLANQLFGKSRRHLQAAERQIALDQDIQKRGFGGYFLMRWPGGCTFARSLPGAVRCGKRPRLIVTEGIDTVL
jgi:hypothetical protein